MRKPGFIEKTKAKMSSRGNFRGSTSARFVKNRRQNNDNNGQKYQKNYNNFTGNRGQGSENGRTIFDEVAEERIKHVRDIDRIDSIFGFDKYESGPRRTGWLVNMHSTLIQDEDSHDQLSGVDYYFLDEEGGSFKVTFQFDPYFLIACPPGKSTELEEWLRRTLDTTVKSMCSVEKEDLDLANHLTGKKGL